MKSILYELYDGVLSPSEQSRPKQEAYFKHQEESRTRYDSFTKSLEPYQLKAFNKILEDQFDQLPFEHADMFVCGFQMGAKMMLAVYQEEIFGEKK